MVLMNLEVRPVVFEDIARQVLATGKRKIPIEFIREIGLFQYLVFKLYIISYMLSKLNSHLNIKKSNFPKTQLCGATK